MDGQCDMYQLCQIEADFAVVRKSHRFIIILVIVRERKFVALVRSEAGAY